MSIEVVRAQLMRGFTGLGIPHAEAAQSVDVGLHAIESALNTMMAKLEPLETRAWCNAYMVALQVGQTSLATMEKAARAKAGELGIGINGEILVDTCQ